MRHGWFIPSFGDPRKYSTRSSLPIFALPAFQIFMHSSIDFLAISHLDTCLNFSSTKPRPVARIEELIGCCLKSFWAANALCWDYPVTLCFNGPAIPVKHLREVDWYIRQISTREIVVRTGFTAWAHLMDAFEHSTTPSGPGPRNNANPTASRTQ